MGGMKGIMGRGAWLKALWAWPNPQLKSMGGERKGIIGMGRVLRQCGRGLNLIAMNGGRKERDYGGKGAWSNAPLK